MEREVLERRRASSLMELCMIQLSSNLSHLADHLCCLPLEIGEALFNRISEERPLYLHELAIFCHAFWKTTTLSLHGVPDLSSQSLHYLYYTASSLTMLDLRGCTWLDSLEFLPVLEHLECLNLRDCWHLASDCLAFIQRLPRLQCLDVENVHSITDASASRYIPGMAGLRALNISGTGVGDGFLEAVTYGNRLRQWIAEHSYSTPGGTTALQYTVLGAQCHAEVIGDADSNMEINYDTLNQWPTIDLCFLRMQRTKISEVSVPYIVSLKKLVLLDIRNTEILGRSLRSLQAVHRLIALPNNSKLLARSNTLLNAALHGACACSSIKEGLSDSHETLEKKPSWVLQWERDGIITLLKKASKLRTVVLPN